MSSSVEIKHPEPGTKSVRNTRTKIFTPFPYTNTYKAAGTDGEILPFMAQVQSPVRVTFTPGPSQKRKSRVSEQAMNAIMHFRPLQRGEKPLSIERFKAPDATLPTLDYVSPWVSITKLDYKNPLNWETDYPGAKDPLTSTLNRHHTESEITSRSGALSPSQSDTASPSKLPSLPPNSRGTSRPESIIVRDSSVKSASTEKRVTIIDPSECFTEMETGPSKSNPCTSSPISSPKSRIKKINLPDSGVNYYSGYLPPELSDKIAAQLDIKSSENMEELEEKRDNPACFTMMKSGQHYKPLIGDRSLFLHETYPVQPKIHQSDIDRLRFEGHERLVKSNGQYTSHFSALKNKGTVMKPQNRVIRLEEAVRKQQRESKSAGNPARLPAKQTSLEQFQRQRERTYYMQNLAREMINK